MIGLPLQLLDGKEYYFASARLGPKGDPMRKLLVEHQRTLTRIVCATLPDNPSLEDGLKYQDAQTALDEARRLNFLELATLSLGENYPNAAEIAENLIGPDLIPVVVRIIRSGQYPEGFTPPSSKGTRTA